MTCKDCVHYDVCNRILNRLEVCDQFKDKTRFVELPCKVGDTIYKVWYLPCHHGETYPDSYNCCGCGCGQGLKVIVDKDDIEDFDLNGYEQRKVVKQLLSMNLLTVERRKDGLRFFKINFQQLQVSFPIWEN